MNCEFCNKELKPLGVAGHIRFCKNNPDRLIKGTPRPESRGKPAWNRGKITPDHTREKISRANSGKSTGIARTSELEELRKKKISDTMKSNPLSGGLRKGSGRGKQGYYKGYWCDSTWELAWVIFNLDKNIDFKRCTESFEYQFNGKTRKYYPDFKIGSIYIEIKGYITSQFIEKKNNFPYTLEIVDAIKIQPILSYVRDKYGNDFIRLYEK